MCGIAGCTWEDKILVKKMTQAIQHRGPDDVGLFTDKGISLGHRRLSIIDLSKKGHQPMFSEDSDAVIVFNGEIYNYPFLKQDLEKKGYSFKSSSDTEAILQGYSEYGLGVLNRLDGMFAFALWDKSKKELILARDRIGKKPLYYYQKGKEFAFASEIKALLENPELDMSLSRQALSNFLTLRFSSGNSTFFSAIKKVEPGTALIIRKGKVKLHRYWSFSQAQKEIVPSRKKIDSLIAESVRKRLLADVPVGVFLSGGLDSSTIVSYMSRFAENIRTFSVGFKDGGDESPYAQKVAEFYNTDHTKIMLSKDILSKLPQVVWHLDEPLADPAALPTYFLSEAVSKKVKVALSGEGGDEVFGGYDSLNKIPTLRKIARIPSTLSRKVISPLLAASSHALVYPHKQMAALAAEITTHPRDLVENTKRLFYFPFNASDKESLLPQLKGKVTFKTASDDCITSKKNIENQVINFYFKEWLPNDLLMKVDKMSMAHGLEVRAPFLDIPLIEYYASLNIRYKYNRSLFRSVVRDKLPPAILKRAKKGFTLPLSSWMQKKEFIERVMPHMNDLQKRGIFEKKAFEKIINRPREFRNDHRLWVLLNLELWYKEFVDKRKPQTINL